jgi:hypothetical protein
MDLLSLPNASRPVEVLSSLGCMCGSLRFPASLRTPRGAQAAEDSCSCLHSAMVTAKWSTSCPRAHGGAHTRAVPSVARAEVPADTGAVGPAVDDHVEEEDYGGSHTSPSRPTAK